MKLAIAVAAVVLGSADVVLGSADVVRRRVDDVDAGLCVLLGELGVSPC